MPVILPEIEQLPPPLSREQFSSLSAPITKNKLAQTFQAIGDLLKFKKQFVKEYIQGKSYPTLEKEFGVAKSKRKPNTFITTIVYWAIEL